MRGDLPKAPTPDTFVADLHALGKELRLIPVS
jgi:hypothetical protein